MNFTLSPDYKSRRDRRRAEESSEDLPLGIVAALLVALLIWWVT